MLLDTLFSVLESAPHSAYAVSLEQKIVFWNRTAERKWLPVTSAVISGLL